LWDSVTVTGTRALASLECVKDSWNLFVKRQLFGIIAVRSD
jgi:hypothetical protein